ncbi:hypothetical protein ABTP97_10875, partial [Acinetobacter baumannii]
MMSRLFLLFVIILMYACTTEADQPKSSNTKLYFSYRICEKSGKCKNFTPTKKMDNYLFKRLEPAYDEFYIKEALLHKDLKCKAPLIEPNLRRNLGKW